ncbi:MAG: SWIM zinc finger family protein [Rhodothermales bacterium]
MLPPILLDLVRLKSSAKVLDRAMEYAESELVSAPTLRGNLLSAHVEGSDWEPYRVLTTCDDATVAEATCTCPYDWGGWCKHIGAVLLTVLAWPNRLHESRPLAELLEHLNADQLRLLMHKVVAEHPAVLDTLDDLLDETP